MISISAAERHEGDQNSLKSSILKFFTTDIRGPNCDLRGLSVGGTKASVGAGVSVCAGTGSSDAITLSAGTSAGVEMTGAGLSMVVLVERLSARLCCGGLDAQLAVDGNAGRSSAGLDG